MHIQIYTFPALNVSLLYQILRLRQQVFIVEQQSIYDDIDGKDERGKHICVSENEELLGYLRFTEMSTNRFKIERVVVIKAARGKGVFRALMQAAINECEQMSDHPKLFLSSQLSVVGLYESWGFEAVGEPYDDAGILHIDMQKLKKDHA